MKTRCEFEQLICPTVATLKVGSFNFVIDSLSLLGFAGIGIWVWRKGRFCEVGMGKDWILGGNGVENGERMDFFFVLFWGREREMGFVTIFVDGEDGWEDREKRGILVA